MLVGKRSHARSSRRWKDSIKVDLTGIRYVVVVWIHLFQNRVQRQGLVNMATNIRDSQKTSNF